MKTNENFVIDSRGNKIPRSMLDPILRERHDTVEAIVRDALKLEHKMRTEKYKFLERIRKYNQKKALRLNVPNDKNSKSNLTLTNISNDKQVEIAMHDIIILNDIRIEAEQVFDQCIQELSENARQELVTIFRNAFNLDKKGKVDIAALRRLKQLKIMNPKWKRFQELLEKAEEVEGTRQYLNIRVRDINGNWKTMNLNFSSI